MPVKRLHYFKYQFLQENDFTDEQDYHVSMRRRHNQDFHTWGRVQGLDVSFTAGERKVTISPGMAVDNLGREIIIESNFEVDLQSHAGETVYLVLAHKKDETDPTTQAGVSGNTRITESFQTSVRSASPPDTSLELILAKITINPGPPSDGAVTTVDTSERTEAGAKIGEAAFPGLKLTVPGHGSTDWPEVKGLDISAPGLQGIEVTSPKTSFSGSLEVRGDLTIKGVVNKTDELVIKDNIIRVNAYEPPTPAPLNVNGGLEVYRGGTAPNAQIIWDESMDNWKIGIAGGLVDVAYGTNWDNLTNNAVTNLHRHSKLVAANGSVDPALSVDNAGNVGIGTTNPKERLQIGDRLTFHDGGHKVIGYNFYYGGNPLQDRRILVDESAVLRFTSSGDIGLQTAPSGNIDSPITWTNGLFITNNGNVGIGTTTPGAKLEISGGGDLLLKASSEDPGDIIFQNSAGAQKGRVWSNPSAGAALYLSSGDITPDIAIDSSGKVGIGTTSPDQSLTVANVAGANYMNVKDGTHEVLMGVDGAGGILSVMSNHDLSFRAGTNSEKMRITAAGNVGIGTPTPQFRFHQVGGDHVVEDADISLRRGGVHRWRIQELATSGLQITQVYNDAGSLLNTVRFAISDTGNVGIGTPTPNSKLQIQYDNTHYVGTNVSATQAYTTYRNDANEWKAGSDGHNGNWYMITANGTDLFQIHQSGTLNVYCNKVYLRNTYNNAITVGRDIAISSIGELGYISSSIRHKKNIRPIDKYSSKIFGLMPVLFDYKDDAKAVNQFGLIAEEVEKILPELVSYDEQQKPETVIYSKLVPLILREVIRIKEQNDTLKEKVKQIVER